MFSWLFRKKKKQSKVKDITLGERDDKGFCDVYVDGEKSNMRMLTFTREECDKLSKIVDEVYKRY